MPAGVDITLPDPLSTTFSATVFAATCVKLAPTVRAALITTAHVPVPLHTPPVHPANWYPAAGDAAKMTLDPWSNGAVQLLPQLMPVGFEPTAPDPVTATVSTWVTGTNVAVTPRAAFMVTAKLTALPLQPPPLQPENRFPLAGVAVRLTVVPSSKEAPHAAAGQSTP